MSIVKCESSRKVFKNAIDKYGETLQMLVLSEEVGELLQAVSKYARGNKSGSSIKNVAEEIADVEIMIEQIKIIMDISEDDLQWNRIKKINRLEKRVSR